MSAQSLAAFRKSAGDDLADLAEQHLQHEYCVPPPHCLSSALTLPPVSPTPTGRPSYPQLAPYQRTPWSAPLQA